MPEHYIEDNWGKPVQKMEIGDKLTTKSRIISRSEIELTVLLAGEYAPQFIDEKSAQENGWRTQLTPGLVSLSICYGLLMQAGFLRSIIAYMGTSDMKFLGPVYPGDSICMEVEVTSKKKARKGWICEYDWTIKNQDGVAVGVGHNI